MLVHFISFFTGGLLFIAGTACYFYPDWAESGNVGGYFYTVGSCGFLLVDVTEFFAYQESLSLRINISMSLVGSLFYLVGSIGFIPDVYDATSGYLGIWGFIMGSLFIGCSQLWKTHRIGSENDKNVFLFSHLFSTRDLFVQTGIELSAGIGAWCFFVGTIMYNHGPLTGEFYQYILRLWEFGSCWFTLGSLFLGYRHFVLGE